VARLAWWALTSQSAASQGVNLLEKPGLSWAAEPAGVLEGAFLVRILEAWLEWGCPNSPPLVNLRARTNVDNSLRRELLAKEPNEDVGVTVLVSSAGANQTPACERLQPLKEGRGANMLLVALKSAGAAELLDSERIGPGRWLPYVQSWFSTANVTVRSFGCCNLSQTASSGLVRNGAVTFVHANTIGQLAAHGVLRVPWSRPPQRRKEAEPKAYWNHSELSCGRGIELAPSLPGS
jgi:hypothetical protein